MSNINEIVKRLNDLMVYGNKDKQIKLYILDLMLLYAYADNKTQAAIIRNADNYLEVLEINYFSKFIK